MWNWSFLGEDILNHRLYLSGRYRSTHTAVLTRAESVVSLRESFFQSVVMFTYNVIDSVESVISFIPILLSVCLIR